KVGYFELERMLIKNYIDACAIFKKSVWELNLGYDVNFPFQGNEDWAFWLGASVNGFKFHYLDVISFNYRYSRTSMINSFNNEMFEANRLYVKKKYADLYYQFFKKYKHQLDYYKMHPLR